MDLADKVAVVTGGGRGLGLATALTGAGASVAVDDTAVGFPALPIINAARLSGLVEG